MNELFVPGRTELAGNHTDHQNGRILASAVDLGLYASFEANGENLCRVHRFHVRQLQIGAHRAAEHPYRGIRHAPGSGPGGYGRLSGAGSARRRL